MRRKPKPVDRVLERLENVRKNSAGWTARCPAHGDNVNSLSVGEGADGRVLLYCHGVHIRKSCGGVGNSRM